MNYDGSSDETLIEDLGAAGERRPMIVQLFCD